MRLAGRLAAVSGASSGIGAATARALAAKGARVALLARAQDRLDAVARAIGEAGGSARVYAVDLADGSAAEAAAARLQREVGLPDVVINCAGAGRWLDLDETTTAEAIQMMSAPYFAAFSLTRALIGEMLARGSGRIVNVNSPAAFVPWPGATGYAAARWALRGFTQALRADLHGSGIRVMHVVAGETDSPYWEHNPDARERVPRISRYLGRLTSEQVADAVVRGIEQDRNDIIIPFLLRAALALHALWPWALSRIIVATGRRRKRAASRGRDYTPVE